MKINYHIIFFLLLSISISAQQKFIKVNSNASFGTDLRILPTQDNGWVILSTQSLTLSKFNACGNVVWTKKYSIPNEIVSLTDFIKSKTGGFILLTRMASGTISSSLITRIDESGFILWSKTYEDFYYDQYGYTINEDNSGNLLLFSNLQHAGNSNYNMLCKINSNGNLLWSKLYNHGGIWGGAIVTGDGGSLLRTGGIFIKTDIDGNVQWTSGGGSLSGYYYYAPVEVSNGYIFTTVNTSNNFANFHKIDLSGNMLINETRRINFTGLIPRIHKKSNGNLTFVFNHYFAGKTYPTIIEMDNNLNYLYQGSISYPNQNLIQVDDFCFDSNSEAILTGNIDGGPDIFYAKLDDLYKTSCDTNLQRVQLIADTSYQHFPTTTAINHTLQEIDHSFSFTNIIDSAITVCTVPLTLDIGRDTTVCHSTNFTLRNNLFGIFDEYRWSTGDSSSYIHVIKSGTYWVTVKNYCEDSTLSDTIRIIVDSIVSPGLGIDRIECETESTVLKTPTCNQCIYQWNTGSHADSIVLKEPGTYWLKIENNNSCISIDTIEIDFAKCDCNFYLPNTFTPNADGINDEFKPVYYCEIREYELQIFDRLSRVIYSTNNAEEGWNGAFKDNNVEEGVYNYMINYIPLIKGVAQEEVLKYGRLSVLY